MQTDCVQPFLFEQLDIRGALVSLDRAWHGLTAGRKYAPPVRNLLGEMSAVTCLISANLKQPGRMTFQLRGDGAVSLLVLDCDEQLRLRGMARSLKDVAMEDLPVRQLLGDGQLLLTLDAPDMRQPYQSLVPMEGDSIAAIFEHYLNLSEQQPTRLLLAADGRRAVGLFVQKLPDADHKDPDGWNRVGHLLDTLTPAEHLAHGPIDLLRRLFPEEDVRLFTPRAVSHHCPEDPEKIHAMLRGLGRAECDAILRDKGEIHVRDDICNRDYRFDAEAVEAVFAAPSRGMH
jgi:molecular chaperone Hsp33